MARECTNGTEELTDVSVRELAQSATLSWNVQYVTSLQFVQIVTS